MKLSELELCTVCGGPIGMLFYRVTVDQIMINAKAANRVLGLNAMFGGSALRLAEAFIDDDVTMELQKNTTILCVDCAYSISLATVLLGVESSWRNDDMRPPSEDTHD